MANTRLIQLLGVSILLSIAVADGSAWRPPGSSPVLAGSRGSNQVVLGPGSSDSQTVVDGEKTPELIPDALAYRHFLSATTVGPKASPQDHRLRSLQLDRVGLSDTDRKAYLAMVQPLRGRLSASITKEPHIMSDTLEQLRGQLTPDGFQRLEEHVRNYVKPRIKIYASAR